MKDIKTKPPPNPEDGPAAGSARYPALEIDYALYERYLDASDWTDAQKRDFIDTLWSIIVQFVDLGFGVHPLQQAGSHVDIPKEFLPPIAPEMLESPDNSTDQHADTPDDGQSPVRERSPK